MKETRLFRERLNFKDVIFPQVAEICRQKGFPIIFEDGADGNPIGEIRSDTASRIDRADVVVLVASPSDKPNAWIELGWADGFWHEPIILMNEKFKLPVDISNWISVPYSDAGVSGADQKACQRLVNKLADMIVKTLKSPRWKVRFPHYKKTTVAVGQVRVYNRFSKAFSFADWSSVIQEAEKEIIIASPRMLDMLERKNAFTWKDKTSGQKSVITFDEFLFRKALIDRVAVTVMMYHPDNYSEHTALFNAGQPEIDAIRRDLNTSYERWADRVRQYRAVRQTQLKTADAVSEVPLEQAFRIVRLRTRYLPYRVTLTEKRAITTLRFYSEKFNSGPCIESWPNSLEDDPDTQPFYEHIRAELQFLIDANAQESEKSFEAFLDRSAVRSAGE